MNTILSRIAYSPFQVPFLSPIQAQADQLVEGFVRESTRPSTLAAMVVGGLAYRFGRVGVMSAGAKFQASMPLRALSVFSGFGAEVGGFELTQRFLSQEENPRRWNWGGESGLGEGFMISALSFGVFRSSGFLVRGQNSVLQHLFQSSAFVASHQIAGELGLVPRPQGSLAQQLVRAETFNLQMSAGMALVHGIFPGWSATERVLDLSIRTNESPWFRADSFRNLWPPWNSFQPQGTTREPIYRPFDYEGGEKRPPAMFLEGEPSEGSSSASAVPNRKFWYPTRNTRKTPIEVDYSGEPEEHIAELERQLKRVQKGAEKASSISELLALRPDENLVNHVWLHQLRQLARSLGVEVKEFSDPEILLVPLREQLGVARPEALREAVRSLKREGVGNEAFRVIELEIPFEEVFFGKPEKEEKATGLGYLLETIEGELSNTVRLAEVYKEKGILRARFMSPSLFERLLRVVHGPEAPLLFYVHGSIPRDLSIRLKALGASPVGMNRGSLRLEDLGVRVPPFLFTLHDLFHTSTLTRFSRNFRQYAGWVYGLCRKNRGVLRSPFYREMMDRLADMNPPEEGEGAPRFHFKYSLRHIADQFQVHFQSEQFRARDMVKYHLFFHKLHTILTKNSPPNPDWHAWHDDYLETIQAPLNDFKEMTAKVAGTYFRFTKQK
jgi:hypothetical protein